MLQVKTFHDDPSHSIDDLVNEFLSTLKTEAVRSIDIKETGFAVIQYEVKDFWDGRMCADCKYWDDSGKSDAVNGLCHECGGRRRFNCRSCEKFKDIRD